MLFAVVLAAGNVCKKFIEAASRLEEFFSADIEIIKIKEVVTVIYTLKIFYHRQLSGFF